MAKLQSGKQHNKASEACAAAAPTPETPPTVDEANACPPEDVGGVGGYADYLEAIADPNHEQHHDLLGWRGPFDSKRFDAAKTTKRMQRGLPDWRRMS